jgi:uncharacterized protein YndB with AHSA1/START domain
MTTTNKTQVVKNLSEKSILVTREFSAPVSDVWRAFTEQEFLDQWWGPAPWHAETKSMDFREGGHWLYVMVGPQNERHYGRMNYIAINKPKFFDIEDSFCDENGMVNAALPVSKGRNSFTPTASGTRVEFLMRYPSEADVHKLIEMGFEQGITLCFEQLESLLTKKVSL